MKIKVHDIAIKAGVSDGTVSNALNNRKGISEQKRDRILQIARDMGYFHSTGNEKKLIRLVVINNKANVIGDTPFFSELIRGIETGCSANGYELAINHFESEDFEDTDVLQLLKVNQTSGILLLATELDAVDLGMFKKICIPLVVLDAAFKISDFDYVAINNVDGTYQIVEHLILNGHKKIGIINSAYQINNFKERRIGYLQALYDYNLDFLPENEALVDPNPEGSYKDMLGYLRSFLSEYPASMLPTAFYAVNDNIAFGALKALRELKLDISICGFDDMPFCEMLTPPLTTVNVDKRYLGKTAVGRLVTKISSSDTNIQKILIATSIVERDSVKNLNEK